MIDYIVSMLRAQAENQFATGGMLLMFLGAAMALMRNVPRHLASWARRRLITTIDVTDHDQAFFWIQKWLADHDYTKSKARLLTLSSRTMPHSNSDVTASLGDGRSAGKQRREKSIEIVFTPAPGVHLIRHRGSFILLTRQRKEAEVLGEMAFHETFVFETFSRDVVRDLVREAREAAFPPEDSRIAVFRHSSWGNGWLLMQRRLPRPIDSVILDGDISDDLVKDMQWFFGAARWYADHGIPYQRTYVLSGPPGNGKTSLATALASYFERDVYIVSLSSTTDDAFLHAMGELGEHSILLIEDVDRAFHGRERTADVSDKLSFSGFINAIDGVVSAHGRIMFMTTNHPEKLDRALLRRADRSFVLSNATPDMAGRLYERFFPGTDGKAFADAFAELEGPVSMSALQEHMIVHRDNPLQAIEGIRRWGQSTAPV